MNRAERRAAAKSKPGFVDRVRTGRAERRAERATAFTVRCDMCGETFTPSVVEQPAADGIVAAFACPNGHRFEAYAIDAAGVEIRERLRAFPAGDPDAAAAMAELATHTTRPGQL